MSQLMVQVLDSAREFNVNVVFVPELEALLQDGLQTIDPETKDRRGDET